MPGKRTHYGGYATNTEYQKARRRQAVMVYFATEAQRDEMLAKSLAAGYQHFSPWIVQMVLNATSGAIYQPEYIENLKQEAERTRRWLDAAREEADDYKRQVRMLQDQRERLLVLLHSLPTGAEVAARFLQQSAREARA